MTKVVAKGDAIYKSIFVPKRGALQDTIAFWDSKNRVRLKGISGPHFNLIGITASTIMASSKLPAIAPGMMFPNQQASTAFVQDLALAQGSEQPSTSPRVVAATFGTAAIALLQVCSKFAH